MPANDQIGAAATRVPDPTTNNMADQPLAVATQAMVHAAALAMANATHTQGCAQQINATAAGALIALIMQSGIAQAMNKLP